MLSFFKNINNEQLLLKNNSLYQKIYNETNNIFLYLNESIKEFPKIFKKDFETLDELLKYLKEISIPNKYVCAKYINKIPGWTCNECSKYTNSIFCHECYKKSKHLHKDHHLYFLPLSGGMCGCGEPEALYTFCPEHSGPHIQQNQINEYISKVFQNEILEKIKLFFNQFFQKFSNYFILTEKCQLFCPEIFNQYFDNDNEENNSDLENEKHDIILLKNNFCIIYQNFLDFLRLISENNLGMIYILSNYFLENHFENNSLEEEFKTNHRCFKLDVKEIEIIYKNEKNHKCQCPFFRLFLSNWRDKITSNKNQNLLLSFTRSFPLKHAFGVIYYAIYKDILMNNNQYLINQRIQFILDYTTVILATKTNLIEETYDSFYEYLSNNLKLLKLKNEFEDEKINEILENINDHANIISNDCELYSMPITRKLMHDKTTFLIKRTIDCFCLIHKVKKFKSIRPHPNFQQKGYSYEMISIELNLLNNIECINMFTQWEKIDNLKEIFIYIINKIINQESEGIEPLSKEEYTFHLGLYRCFGILINYFCYYYSFNNNFSIYESIQIFKKNFFDSEKKLEIFVNILLNDYFKLFGFISGILNGFFNYYDSMNMYVRYYFSENKLLKIDITLLKYLLVLCEKNINLDYYLKISNIENAFSFFEKNFLLNNVKKKNNKKDKYKNNISSNELIDLLNESHDIFPSAINYGNNLEFIRELHDQHNGPINPYVIQQFINDNNNPIEDEVNMDEYNYIMHCRFLLELLVTIMKDDSSPYYSLMNYFKRTSSTETRKDLFDEIKKNKNAMGDLENILKENIIREFVAQGNLTDITRIKETIDNYLIYSFDEKYFNKIIDELTLSKKNGDKKLFFLKDSSFKYLDMSNYHLFKDKSNAQKYIFDFKKDVAKIYNTYFYNPSKLTFNFFEKIYENILLNKTNLEIIIKIIENILINNQENGIINSVKYSLLIVMLKYLSIFSCINSKSFIHFKFKNEELINKINTILSNVIKDKDKDKLLDQSLKENIIEVFNQLNLFKIINMNINGDLSKLDNFNYNTEYNNNSKNIINKNNFDENNNCKKSKNIKEHLKNLMKKKVGKFMEKVKSNEEMLDEINNQNEIKENIDNNNDNETMCFFCRNPIILDSFEVSYGKGGFLFNDLFYSNSINASIKSELKKLTDKYENVYNDMIQNNINNQKVSQKIISCGHVFHLSCFMEKNENSLTCPLCTKKQNVLIPPLIHFHNKYNFLKPYKISKLFKEIEMTKTDIEEDFNLFVEIVNFFLSYHLDSSNSNTYLEQITSIFHSYFNYLENIFYFNGTNFHKIQQIETIQNLILALRYITKAGVIKINSIINYIIEEFSCLIQGPKESENIIINYENIFYMKSLEKLLLYLCILFDYEQMKELFIYIIYIFLPYLSFGFFLRHLISKNNFYSLYNEELKEEININNLKKYFDGRDEEMIDSFKLFLKKLSIIKILADYTNKNENIINKFNELNIEELLLFLNLDKLNDIFKKNNKNEIIFNNIIEVFPKIVDNLKEIFDDELVKDYNYEKIYNQIMSNIKNNKNEKYLIPKELIVHFSPIKFNFTHLDNNIFDFIETNLEKKCIECSQVSRYFYICLVCGNKVCHTTNCNGYSLHTLKCTGKYCIFVDMENTTISISKNNATIKQYTSLYNNEEGIGPRKKKIGREFYLNKEKEKIFFRNFVCYDFHFN